LPGKPTVIFLIAMIVYSRCIANGGHSWRYVQVISQQATEVSSLRIDRTSSYLLFRKAKESSNPLKNESPSSGAERSEGFGC
jgi:hypothetical protein